MFNPHYFVADKQIEFTIIAPCKLPLTVADQWLQSLLAQGHSQKTEVIVLFPEAEITNYLKSQWQKVLKIYKTEIEQSPYSFSFVAIGDHDDAVSLAITLNKVISLANGEWIYISPTNNQLLKSTFFEFTAVIKEFPEVELISGRFHRLGSDQKILEKSSPLELEGFTPNTFKYHFLQQNPLRFGSTLFRKYIWEKSRGLNPEFADVAWWESGSARSLTSLRPDRPECGS